MGEYANYNGEQVKIGTCEQMYYLRADQVHKVTKAAHSLDPRNRQTAEQIRFRFPFPDEDAIQPGAFQGYNRAIWLYDVAVPEKVDHYSIQLQSKSPAGLVLLSAPCPHSPDAKASGLKFGFNGYSGAVGIHSQKLVGGALQLVCICGGCGALWRMDSLEDCAEIIDALGRLAQTEDRDHARYSHGESGRAGFYRDIAARIVSGYSQPNFWTFRRTHELLAA
mgnify:FL=1